MVEVLFEKSRWHYGNTIAFQREWRWQWKRNDSACVCVLEGVEYNSDSFFMSVCEKWLTRGERGHDCYYLPLLHPSINPSSHTHTHENTHRFSQLQWSVEQSPFQPLYSWEKLMDLNCITGRRQGPEGASKPGEGGTEMEFWLNRRENNPSLTVWRLSLPFSLLLQLSLIQELPFLSHRLHFHHSTTTQMIKN